MFKELTVRLLRSRQKMPLADYRCDPDVYNRCVDLINSDRTIFPRKQKRLQYIRNEIKQN